MQRQWIQRKWSCGNVTICTVYNAQKIFCVSEISQWAHQIRPLAYQTVELTQVDTLWTRDVHFRELFPHSSLF